MFVLSKKMLRVCASRVNRILVLCEIFVYVCEKACKVEKKIIYPKGLNDLIFWVLKESSRIYSVVMSKWKQQAIGVQKVFYCW